ncbi:MAG: LPS assembly protein LptD [Planctomycetota bacterium]|jgi:hypothetical protein
MRACVLAGALLAVVSVAAGEESERVLRIAREIREVKLVSTKAWGDAFAFVGDVSIEYEGAFRLRAQGAVVWFDPRADASLFKLMKGMQGKERRIPIWAVRAVYARGGRAPALFHAGGRIFRCKELFYDFATHKGLLVDADMRLKRGDAAGGELDDLVLRAKHIWAKGPGEWEMREAHLFATDYHEPEVGIGIDRVIMRDEAVGEVLGELMRLSERASKDGVGIPATELERIAQDLHEAALAPNAKVELHKISARLFGVPFLKWRRIRSDEDEAATIRAEVEAGGRGLLGTGAVARLGLKSRPVGFLLGAGYYLDHGPILDLELDVNVKDRLFGRSFGVYMHDDGDYGGFPPPTKDRWWTKNQYRWLISETWRLDGEYADLSDPAWLRQYDEQEFKEGKRQETLLYLRGRNRVGYATAIVRVRTISFQDEVEQLPALGGSLPVWNILSLGERTSLQLAGSVQLGNLRYRHSDLAGLQDPPRTWRFDVDPTLYVAFNLGPLRFTPFAEFRFTGYEHALSGDSLGRFAGTAGLRVDTQFARWYGETRHVVNVELDYTDLYALTEDASNFFPMDDIDRISAWEGVTLRLRNRLQKRSDDGFDNFFSFEIHGAWFPDRQQPLGKVGDGFVDFQLNWYKRRHWGALLRSDVNADPWTIETFSIEGWAQARSNVVVGASYRHLDGDSDVLTATTAFDVDRRWNVLLFSQYDFRNTEPLDQGIQIDRFFRTVMIGLKFTWRPADNGANLSFKVDLTEAFRKRERVERNDYRRQMYWK